METLRIETLCMLLFFTVSLRAQVPDKRGYIGMSLGPSFLAGYWASNGKTGTGLNINLINFGYVLGKGFGVSAAWVGGAHLFHSRSYVLNGQGNGNSYSFPVDSEVSYGMLLVGPMYCVALSGNSYLDFRGRCGVSHTTEKMSSSQFGGNLSTESVGYSIGVGYRIKLAPRWCILLSGDYYSGRMHSVFSASKRITPISLNAGIGFLL